MDPLSIVEWVRAGGVALMFIVWYYTFKNFSDTQKQISKENLQAVNSLTDKMTDAYQEAISAQRSQNEVLMKLIKEQQENQSHLIGVLTQIKEQLNQPRKCALSDKQFQQNLDKP